MTGSPGFYGNQPPIIPASGTSRRWNAFQADHLWGPYGGLLWPALAVAQGGIATTLSAFARIGVGADGFGGLSTFPASPGDYPQMTWLEGNSYKSYGVNFPLKFASNVAEKDPPQSQVYAVGGSLKWENLTAPPPGYDSGVFFTTWSGTSGSIITNGTGGGGGVGYRGFGLGRQQTTGTFGFFGVVNGVVTFTPVVHPGGDVRIPLWFEFRLYDATGGRSLRGELWLNGFFQLAFTFTVGNPYGLPYDYPASAYTQFVFTPFAEALQRLWVGKLYFAGGPNEPAMF